MEQYDVVIIGAGHAGCEAASAAARCGCHTCLVTMDMEKISNSVWNDIISTDSFDEKKEAFEKQVVSELQL